MVSKKVLFITQAITPYVPETFMSAIGKRIPQAIQEKGNEIRTFLPKWGIINERRNQLHEVIRLSGLNVIINETDHPLIIKVASLQSAHMQVYFIDSEDFFQKRLVENDKKGVEYTDNYERSIFYSRSVLETVKKLRWYPDIIHCQGWISATTPFYVKTVYKDEPAFANTKVVYSLHNMGLKTPMPQNYRESLAFRHVTPEVIDSFNLQFNDAADFAKLAINFSDGAVLATDKLKPEVVDFARQKEIPLLEYQGEKLEPQQYSDLYDRILGE